MVHPQNQYRLSRLTRIVILVAILGYPMACRHLPAQYPPEEEGPRGFTNFETGPVKPLVLSTDRRFLFALNTADDRVEIFDTRGDRLQSIGETAVGLRPVALALRNDNELWVVNHLSDSVSVVDVKDPRRPRVVYTLSVGDEPRGICVAGPHRNRIFVATARRDDNLTPGIGRALVWIFDADRPEVPPQIITLFGTKPRPMAASPDGRFVYAGIFLSGNRTATVSGEDAVRMGRISAFSPFTFGRASAVPKFGPIVVQTPRGWRGQKGEDWTPAIPFNLPDYDIFIIDAAAEHPAVVDRVSSVGTVLFNMAVQPGSGDLWVTNTEAMNLVATEPALRATFADNRITRVRIQSATRPRVQPQSLNQHFEEARARGVPADPSLSLAQPTDIVFRPDGLEAYIAAFGSRKIGVVDADGHVVDRIAVGFGPGGLSLDSRRGRLYVLNHLDATLSVVDVKLRRTVATVPLRHDPTPQSVKRGRPFLYDALLTSGNGALSCNTCHIFGDLDGLAWDLGRPGGEIIPYPRKLYHKEEAVSPRQHLHPLKGPMMTQSLRGLAGTAPFHWRGDRFGDLRVPGQDLPSFAEFNKTFVDLLDRSDMLPAEDMDAMARFIFTIRYPPNPIQRPDRSLDPVQRKGFAFFTGPFLSGRGVLNCSGCHSLPLGTGRRINFEGRQVARDMKAAHLRNVYQKVGRFNVLGDQVTGFGLIHDGSLDTVVNFLKVDVFRFPGDTEAEKDVIRRHLHDYIMAFDTGMAPIVGRQLTVGEHKTPAVDILLQLFMRRTEAGDADLIARGWEDGTLRGWLYRDGFFEADQSGKPPLSLERLISHYQRINEPLTFTCVPPGDGIRSALDRDQDGRLNADDCCTGRFPPDAYKLPAP